MSWDQLGKIRQHGGKERLKISKIEKFESDLLKTNKGIAPQSRVILRDVCMVGGKFVPPPQTSVKFRDFVDQYLRSLWTYLL